jgi:hypothetical protein
VVNITIYFRGDKVMSAEDVTIEETMTALIVYTGPGEKSVIPLSAILYYDVEEVQ